jgi:hypothetical protein
VSFKVGDRVVSTIHNIRGTVLPPKPKVARYRKLVKFDQPYVRADGAVSTTWHVLVEYLRPLTLLEQLTDAAES